MAVQQLKNEKKTLRLDRYAGEWVVLVGTQVIAHASSLEDAMRLASAKRGKLPPSVFLVPRKDEGPFILFSPGKLSFLGSFGYPSI